MTGQYNYCVIFDYCNTLKIATNPCRPWQTLIAELQICWFSLVQPSIGKSGMLYIWGVRPSVGRHSGDSSDLTVAFEDAQEIPPFSRRRLMIQIIQMIQRIFQWPFGEHSVNFWWPFGDLSVTFQWPISDLSVTFQWPFSDLSVTFQWPFSDLLVTFHWHFSVLSVTFQWFFSDLSMKLLVKFW